MLDLKFKCHWHDFICENDGDCIGCPHNPKDEDKPNYHKPKAKVQLDGYGAPICPSCGEFVYINNRCIFCGQALKSLILPKPLIVGWKDYRLVQVQGVSHGIYVYKEGRFVMHAQCRKAMTPKEARKYLKSIPKCFKALSEAD